MASGTILKSNLGVINLLNESNVSTSAAYASTGKTFTMAKPGLVKVAMSYGSGRPIAIGCKYSESAGSGSELLTAIDPSAIEYTSGLSASGYLPAGTYYVWCKTAAAGNTTLRVEAVYLCDI